MLILSRKMGESIYVGDSVTVTVLGVTRGQVKIGIDAPKELTVHREEIYRRIQEEKFTGCAKNGKANERRKKTTGRGPVSRAKAIDSDEDESAR